MKVNPITLEVVSNALVAYAEEMALALCGLHEQGGTPPCKSPISAERRGS